MSVERGAAHNSHDDLMSTTGERHWLALSLRVGQAGKPDWLNTVADRLAFELGLATDGGGVGRAVTHHCLQG